MADLSDCFANCTGDCMWFECQSPYTQTALATLFTWGGTALGAAVVFCVPTGGKKTFLTLDISLGFAAGVMLAASFWGLLAPALEEADEGWGSLSFIPVSIGFLVGVSCVAIGGSLICLDDDLDDLIHGEAMNRVGQDNHAIDRTDVEIGSKAGDQQEDKSNVEPRQSFRSRASSAVPQLSKASYRRIITLCIAITIHNIPEGAAVGVSFGSGSAATGLLVTFAMALQNFPEGLAVALPLRASGETRFMAFFWGQLSGVVEPIFGLISVAIVSITVELMPYALAFAAGAMIYVVLEDIIPDANERKNGPLAAKVAVFGFLITMALEVGLAYLFE